MACPIGGIVVGRGGGFSKSFAGGQYLLYRVFVVVWVFQAEKTSQIFCLDGHLLTDTSFARMTPMIVGGG